MSIGQNIKLLREHFGITQEELAKIAGVSDKAVSTWELGRYEPRMGAIQKIADHFHIKKANLIEDNGMEQLLKYNSLEDLKSSNVGEKIRAKRIELGYTQDDLTKMLGYENSSTIAKIESGETAISQTTIYEFAHAMNCSPSDFLDIQEFTVPDRVALREAFGPYGIMLVKDQLTDDDIKFINQLNKLSPENKDKIRELINLYLDSQNKGE